MRKRRKDYHPYIDSYMDDIRSGKIPASKRLKLALNYIEFKLNDPDVFIDYEKIDKAVELIERYFEMTLLNWELFILALIHCYYKPRDIVVFNKFLIVMGRGNGKNGFISALSWYLTTHYHGVKGYNIDIIANNEEQAKTSFEDIYNILEDTWTKSKRFFHKTKQVITNIITKSYVKFNTSNSRTKDGKRAACLIFDEIHEYETYDSINVFQRSFGKRKHSRIFMITTNGYVREGVLDSELALADQILNGDITNLRTLPLIWEIDSKEEAMDPKMWIKANPSLPYFTELKQEMEEDFILMKHQNHVAVDFLTKRMNYPVQNKHEVAIPWEQIAATNQEIPYEELKGQECIGALDYAEITDFASVGLLFKHKGKRYFIEHTFVCRKALEIESREIKFPVEEMAQRGLITIIERERISEKDIADWFVDKAKKYHIKTIVGDDYRISLLRDEFKSRGLPLESCRSGPITHAKLAPLIESMFADKAIVFGDNPTMRWYTNNTGKERDKKGNITYFKIEPKTRKTDGFFALIHALTRDDQLVERQQTIRSMGVYTY